VNAIQNPALQNRVLPDDPRIGFWTALLIAAVLVVWRFSSIDAEGGGQMKYILYLLPFFCIAFQALLRNLVVPFHPPGAQAVGLYVLAAGSAILAGRSSNPFLVRDLLIIGTYLMMFSVAWSATHREVMIVSATCFACMVIEALQEGISLNVDILASDGILESVMAFPLGVIVLYAFRTRRLVFGLVTGILFFAAYKRIAIMAVIAVLAFEWAIVTFGLARRRRALAIVLVILLSLSSLFSMQLFEYGAKFVGGENVSANSLSLGRFEFSVAIWREVEAAPMAKLLFGHGPGSADTIVQTADDHASNPHNDWLKIFVDYGAFGFVLFHLILLRMFAGSPFGILIYLYTAIVMTTDNSLIYTFHHVIVLVVLRAAASMPLAATAPLRWSTHRHPPVAAPN
jgi:hypothetical protein